MVSTLQRTATPASYLACAFDLPARKYVGILASQRDSLLTQIQAVVLSCDKIAPIPAKKAKGAPPEVPRDVYEVQLDDTVLFPEGGGQGSDTGTITCISSGKIVQVLQVLRRNLDAIHYCDSPLDVGEHVIVDIDFNGRLDKQAQHTGQHLLSGMLERELNIPTLSWSLSPSPTPCYIEIAGKITTEQTADMQAKCNEFITRNAAVKVEVKLVGDDVALPNSVPSDYTGGVLRTVEIEGLDDRNPCCGTHFPSLSYLQAIFLLPTTTSITRAGVSNTRLHFVVGPRVLSMLGSLHEIVKDCATEFSCSNGDVAPRLAALSLSAKEGRAREKALREEVAGAVAQRVWTESVITQREGGTIRRGLLVRAEEATNDLEFLSLVSANLSLSIADAPSAQHLFILATSGGVSSNAGGAIIILGTDSLVAQAGQRASEQFGKRVRGGGKHRWQGKLAEGHWSKEDEIILSSILSLE